MWNTPPEYWFLFINQLDIISPQDFYPYEQPIEAASEPNVLLLQPANVLGSKDTTVCICYLDIQSRDVKYCQVNQLGNCAMNVAQSCCGRSSMWLFFVATIHVGA